VTVEEKKKRFSYLIDVAAQIPHAFGAPQLIAAILSIPHRHFVVGQGTAAAAPRVLLVLLLLRLLLLLAEQLLDLAHGATLLRCLLLVLLVGGTGRRLRGD